MFRPIAPTTTVAFEMATDQPAASGLRRPDAHDVTITMDIEQYRFFPEATVHAVIRAAAEGNSTGR
jgi:hypothetical protein